MRPSASASVKDPDDRAAAEDGRTSVRAARRSVEGQGLPGGDPAVVVVRRCRAVPQDGSGWQRTAIRWSMARVDVTVGSPERLVYEGEVSLGKGLERLPRNSTVIGGNGVLCAAESDCVRRPACACEAVQRTGRGCEERSGVPCATGRGQGGLSRRSHREGGGARQASGGGREGVRPGDPRGRRRRSASGSGASCRRTTSCIPDGTSFLASEMAAILRHFTKGVRRSGRRHGLPVAQFRVHPASGRPGRDLQPRARRPVCLLPAAVHWRKIRAAPLRAQAARVEAEAEREVLVEREAEREVVALSPALPARPSRSSSMGRCRSWRTTPRRC